MALIPTLRKKQEDKKVISTHSEEKVQEQDIESTGILQALSNRAAIFNYLYKWLKVPSTIRQFN